MNTLVKIVNITTSMSELLRNRRYLSDLFSVLIIAITFILTACGNSSIKTKSKQNNDNNPIASSVLSDNALDMILEKSIDIPISINLIHTDDEDMKQLVDAEYAVTKETDQDIYIDINSEYYKKYKSGKRFLVPHLGFFEKSENAEFLTLGLDVVNNTDHQLDINEMNLIVAESKPDTIPIIYICTTDAYSNCIYFVNESWFNWGGFTFSYSILEKGESFNGKYKNRRHIPFFNQYTIVNLLPDMIEMGYNFDELLRCIRIRNKDNIKNNETDWDGEPWEEDENSSLLLFYIKRDDPYFNFYQTKFSPFELKENDYEEYTGIATLYGSIEFDHIKYTIDFVAEISLSTSAGFGALSYVNDSFDVKLNSSGTSYVIRYPYTTVIAPYGSEYVKLTVTADKSSTHRFYIDLKTNNDIRVRSKNVHFHHYFPKN